MGDKKYHISTKGRVAVCNATKNACPREKHFDTKDEAVTYIQNKMEKDFELLPQAMENNNETISSREETIGYYKRMIEVVEDRYQTTEYVKRAKLANAVISLRDSLSEPEVNFKKPQKRHDEREIARFIENEKRNEHSYYQRLLESEYLEVNSIDDLNLNNKDNETYHYTHERELRIKAINEYLGEGETVGVLRVLESDDTDVSVPRLEKNYEEHYVDLRDNGRVVIHGNDGIKITTYIIGDDRASVYLKMANIIPNKQFLNKVRLNKLASDLLGIAERDDEVKNEIKRRERSELFQEQKRQAIAKDKENSAKRRYERQQERKRERLMKAKNEEEGNEEFYEGLLNDNKSRPIRAQPKTRRIVGHNKHGIPIYG